MPIIKINLSYDEYKAWLVYKAKNVYHNNHDAFCNTTEMRSALGYHTVVTIGGKRRGMAPRFIPKKEKKTA